VPFCHVLQDGRAVRTGLRLGARVGPMVEVLKKRPVGDNRWQDITGEEAVLQGTPGALTDGARVEVVSTQK
jgi:hypothetical protein